MENQPVWINKTQVGMGNCPCHARLSGISLRLGSYLKGLGFIYDSEGNIMGGNCGLEARNLEKPSHTALKLLF